MQTTYAEFKTLWEKDCFALRLTGKLVYTGFKELVIVDCTAHSIFTKLGPFSGPGELLNLGTMKKNGKNKLAFVPYLCTWLNDMTKRTLDNFMCLPPPCFCDNNVTYNTWKGFVENDIEYTLEEKEWFIGIFLRFMDHVGQGTASMAEFVIFFMADMVQNPGRKPGILLVLLGDEGTFKGTLYDLFKIILGKYAQQTSDSSKVFTRFNTALENNILTNLNEAETLDMVNKSGPLKSLITDSEIIFESKGKDSREGMNHSRFIVSSNQKVAVKASTSDRRNFYIDTTPMSDELRFDIRSLINSEKAAKILFDYLKNDIEIPYKNMYDWQSNRPISKKHLEVIDVFRDPFHYFIKEVIDEQEQPVMFYGSKDLYVLYTDYMRTNEPNKNVKVMSNFAKAVKHLDGVVDKTKKINGKGSRGKLINKAEVLEYLVIKKLIELVELDEVEDDIPVFDNGYNIYNSDL